MGRYRKIQAKIWTDKKFLKLSPMKPSGQGLWLFLLTSPQNGPMPGFIHSGRAAMAEELGWKQKQFDAAFKEIEEQGMVKADFTARLIWLPNAIKYNRPESPNVIKSWGNEYEMLPECALLEEAIKALRAYIYTMGEAFQEAFDEVFCSVLSDDSFKGSQEASGKASDNPSPKPFGDPCGKAMANQEQEQEQEQEQKSLCGSDFSCSGAHNPNEPAISQRLSEIASTWNNLDIGPPFTLTFVNLRHDEKSNLLTGLNRYTDSIIINAMRNFKGILDSPDHDPGGCKGYSLFSFLTKGVDRYRDEAKPFERFRKRGKGPSPPVDDQYDNAIREMMGG